MNAQSYLQSYGWTPGTSLGNPLSHAPSASSCPSAQRLTKRILISTKNNTLGVGRKPSNLNHADLWWEKAFDVSLKKLDVTKDTSTISQEKKDVVDNMNLFADLGGGRGFGGTSLPGEGKAKSGKKVSHSHAPLYRYFVRGQGLEGTITSISTSDGPTTSTISNDTEARSSKKRKRDDTAEAVSSLSKSERKALKTERKRLRGERRAARAERRKLRAERRAAKEEKKKLKAEKKANKKAKKAEAASLASSSEEEKPGVQSDSGVDLSADEASAEEAVKPERKEREQKDKDEGRGLKTKDKSSRIEKKKKKGTEDTPKKAKDGSKKSTAKTIS